MEIAVATAVQLILCDLCHISPFSLLYSSPEMIILRPLFWLLLFEDHS
jgi:hypothetical protein